MVAIGGFRAHQPPDEVLSMSKMMVDTFLLYCGIVVLKQRKQNRRPGGRTVGAMGKCGADRMVVEVDKK